MHGRPVAAADRAVALEVGDRLGRQQVALVAVEGDEDRPQVLVQREPEPRREDRVHVPAEAEDPGVLRDRPVHGGVAVHGHDLDVGVDVVARALRPHPLAELAEHRGELLAPVQPDAAVADEVAERGDALHVVAEVGRRPVRARVAVVHDRDRAAPAGRRRRRRRARVGGDPVAQRVAVARGVRPGLGVAGDVLVEAGEDGARQLLLAGAEHRGQQLVPGARADPGRVLAHERAHRRLRLLRRLREPRAHPLRGRERGGGRRRHVRQLGVREREEAAVVGDDGRDDGAGLARRGARAQPGGQRAGLPAPAGLEVRAAARDPGGGSDGRRGRLRRRPAAQPPRDAPGEPAHVSHGRRGASRRARA